MSPINRIVVDAAAICLGLGHIAAAASSDDWRSRSIYQVLTDRFARTDGSTTATCDTADREYCGGSFTGIENHLDYIQGMGFDAVWISPITTQVQGDSADGEAYHGYWQTDLYGVNSHFGTAEELQSLSTALHSRGMYLMLDIVVNHNGFIGSPSDVDYSSFNPFNSESQYHPYCTIDYSDTSNATNIEQCWMGDTTVPLADLRTEDSDVASGYQTWVSQLVANYSIDGIRMDSMMEVDTDFWSGFSGAAGVYIVGEVDNSDISYVCGFQQYLPGVLNYGLYTPLFSAFSSTSGSLPDLADAVNSVQADCADTSLLGTFSENHDQPRFASETGDLALAQNIIAFTMLADGIPIIYEGQEQHYDAEGGSSDPYNREALWLSGYDTAAPLYALFTTLNTIRKHAGRADTAYYTTPSSALYTDTTTLAMAKRDVLGVFSNKGADGAAYTQTIDSAYDAGTALTELLSCATLTAGADGALDVPMAAGAPRVYYPTSGLTGSGLCGASAKVRRTFTA